MYCNVLKGKKLILKPSYKEPLHSIKALVKLSSQATRDPHGREWDGWMATFFGKEIASLLKLVKAADATQEAWACYYAVHWAIDEKFESFCIHTDSKYLINQLNSLDERHVNISPIIDNIIYLISNYSFCKIVKTSR